MNEINLSSYIDLYIAGGIILLVIIIFVISRIGILPKKSVPYLAAAAAGAIGYGIFNRWRSAKLMKEYNKAKEDAERVKEQLSDMEKKYKISQQKREEIIAEEENKIAAHQKHILLLNEKEKQKKEEIEKLSGSDLDRAFDDYLARTGGN